MTLDVTAKENLLAVIRDHAEPAYTPVFWYACAGVQAHAAIEKGNMLDKPDPFGVLWAWDSNAFGPMPAPGKVVLEDVTKWESVVTFPSADDYDWEAEAAADLARIDRDAMALEFVSPAGPFERLTALMGFEGALLAMALEPDATFALLERIAEHKIEVVRHAAQYYAPDMFTMCDDVATVRNLFMAPETYREMISPLHKRIFDECHEHGIIANIHICGLWEPILDDVRAEGVDVISSVQPMNDIAGILASCEDEVAISGGFDSQGVPGYTEDASIVEAERQRCYDEYSSSKGFIYANSAMGLMRVHDEDGNLAPFEEQLAATVRLACEDEEWFRKRGFAGK